MPRHQNTMYVNLNSKKCTLFELVKCPCKSSQYNVGGESAAGAHTAASRDTVKESPGAKGGFRRKGDV